MLTETETTKGGLTQPYIFCSVELLLVTMNSLSVYLLFCSVLSFYGITTASKIAKQHITNTSTSKSWRSAPENSFVGSAFALDQVSTNQTCFPDSWKLLLKHKMIIVPKNRCSPVDVLRCCCLESISSNVDTGLVPNIYFGRCFYGCFNPHSHYQVQPGGKINKEECAKFNRTGILCGQCKDGYGPAAYSFSLKCVECGNSTHWTRVPLYILVAYGPLTVFLGVIVVFTVSVNSAPLHGWIFVCQLFSANIVMRFLTTTEYPSYEIGFPRLLHLLGSIYGMWNLDFFRSIYTPFCLHPSLTTLQVLTLDYIIAAYPLVL